MTLSVYIESSVISYFTARASKVLSTAVHQEITWQWWERSLPNYIPFISPVVIEEISEGDPAAAKERLSVVEKFSVLEVLPETIELSELYFQRLGLPPKARADVLHIALASYHGMDFLVTWNCAHIANGNMVIQVEEINNTRGIHTPYICTPEELMGG